MFLGCWFFGVFWVVFWCRASVLGKPLGFFEDACGTKKPMGFPMSFGWFFNVKKSFFCNRKVFLVSKKGFLMSRLAEFVRVGFSVSYWRCALLLLGIHCCTSCQYYFAAMLQCFMLKNKRYCWTNEIQDRPEENIFSSISNSHNTKKPMIPGGVSVSLGRPDIDLWFFFFTTRAACASLFAIPFAALLLCCSAALLRCCCFSCFAAAFAALLLLLLLCCSFYCFRCCTAAFAAAFATAF